MNIETYENGVLVESKEIDSFEIPPNYSNFNTEIFFSLGYLKIVAATRGTETRGTLELLATRLELKQEVTSKDLEIFKIVWDNIIDLVGENVLTEEDNQYFNIKANENFIPYRFGEDFKLILNN